MSKATVKLTKKMEQRINERAMFLLLTEKIQLDEISFNWLSKLPVIGKVFDKERSGDERSGDQPIPDPKITKINIPLPISDEDKKTILKNPEVRNLLRAFYAKWNIGSAAARQDFMKSLMLDPNRMIPRFTMLAGLDNEATKGDETSKAIEPDNPEDPLGDGGDSGGTSSKEVSVQNELIPKLGSISRKDRDKVQALKNLIGKKILKLNAKIDISKDHMVDILRKNKFSEEEVEELLGIMGNKKIVKEQLAITNLSEIDVAELVSEINKFYPYAKEYLGFDRPVELTLISDPDNAKDTFGKTAYYSPANEQMTIFVDGRHPKDIIRSFSHELVHHAQNCRGEFDRDFSVGENYIETDDHLKEMEREAYDKGNMCLRTYESYLKKENKTMNEETLRKSIREAIKRVVETKTTVAEEETVTMTEDSGEEEAWNDWKNEHADDDHIKEIERHLRALRDDRDHERDEAEYDHDKYEDEGMEEGLKDTGLTGVDGDDDGETYDDHYKKDAIKEEWGAKKDDRKRGGSYTHEKDDTEEEEDKADYEKPTSKAGKERRKKAGLDEADVEEGKDWGANQRDYTRKKDKAGVRKKTGDVGGGKYGKGGHYKDYEMDESQETPLNESLAAKKGQLVFDKLVKKWCK